MTIISVACGEQRPRRWRTEPKKYPIDTKSHINTQKQEPGHVGSDRVFAASVSAPSPGQTLMKQKWSGGTDEKKLYFAPCHALH